MLPFSSTKPLLYRKKLVAAIDEQLKEKIPAAAELMRNSSFLEVNKYFDMLDKLGLSELLGASLGSLTSQELHFVVLGPESSGKSTVLERLMNLLLLPRAADLCTRIGIKIRLRNCPNAAPPELRVISIEDNTTLEGPIIVPATGGDQQVGELMEKWTTGKGEMYSLTHELELLVQGPNVRIALSGVDTSDPRPLFVIRFRRS